MIVRLLILGLVFFASIPGVAGLAYGQELPQPILRVDGKPSVAPTPSAPPNVSSEQEVGEGDTIRVEANLVTVPASITDRDGRYITDLRKEDFQIFEDGVEQEIALFAPAEQPFTVLFLVDVSSSMSPYIENLRRAVNGFASRLRPDDQLIVTTFFQWVHVLLPATRVGDLHGDIQPKLSREDDCPTTYLYDAVDDALNRMKRINGRKAIIVFSDGYGDGFSATAKGTLRKAEEQGALIYTVQFGTPPPEVPRNVNPKYFFELIEKVDGYMRNLAQKTGGRYLRVRDILDFATTFNPVADELRRQYMLGYYPKQHLEPGQQRQIKVRVHQPNLAVRARDSFTVAKDRAKGK